MKRFITFSAIFISLPLFGETLIGGQSLLNIQKFGFSEFFQSVDKVKKIKDISYVDEVDFHLKPYFKHKQLWTNFDSKEYKNLWQDKFETAFSISEQKRINQTLQNPFYKKVFQQIAFSVDFFEFYNRMKLIKDYNGSADLDFRDQCKQLSQVLYLDIFKDYVKPLLDLYQTKRGEALSYDLMTSYAVLISWNIIETRKKELPVFLQKFYATSWKNLSTTELREFTRLLKSDELFKRFSILFVNYHYLYMLQFVDGIYQNLDVVP